jgi:hypothetical protein
MLIVTSSAPQRPHSAVFWIAATIGVTVFWFAV